MKNTIDSQEPRPQLNCFNEEKDTTSYEKEDGLTKCQTFDERGSRNLSKYQTCHMSRVRTARAVITSLTFTGDFLTDLTGPTWVALRDR